MTTEATPDGGQTDAVQTTADEGGTVAEPIRDVSELKKAFKARDRYKGEVATLREQITKLQNGDLIAENDALRAQLQELTQATEQLKAADAAKASALEEQTRAGRRREITDVILGRAHPEHRDEVEGLILRSHDKKEIDLFAEDTQGEGGKALDKLAKRYPKLFRASDGQGHGGAPASASRSYGNPRFFSDLTPEQQASLSKEDFEKMFGRTGDPFGGSGPVVQRQR